MNLENRITKIEERNKNVEGDKAWETSFLRRSFIALMTYVVAAGFLYVIDVAQPYFAAFVPTGGYIFSTLSLSFLRNKWTAHSGHKK